MDRHYKQIVKTGVRTAAYYLGYKYLLPQVAEVGADMLTQYVKTKYGYNIASLINVIKDPSESNVTNLINSAQEQFGIDPADTNKFVDTVKGSVDTLTNQLNSGTNLSSFMDSYIDELNKDLAVSEPVMKQIGDAIAKM